MSETEKITINLGLVDLGQIDLLVQERWRVEEEHERSREWGEGTYRVGFDP